MIRQNLRGARDESRTCVLANLEIYRRARTRRFPVIVIAFQRIYINIQVSVASFDFRDGDNQVIIKVRIASHRIPPQQTLWRCSQKRGT